MKISYSRINCYNQCPYRYKLQYIDHLSTIPDDNPTDPLVVGNAMHKAIQEGPIAGMVEYYRSYPIINDNHIAESLKLEFWANKLKNMLPRGEYEVEIRDENFLGYIDLLAPTSNLNVYDLYDFKYTNNIDGYLDSEQLHVYKYFFEKLNPTKHIRKLFYVFIPKCNLRLKKSEDIFSYRRRIKEDLESKAVQIRDIPFEIDKVTLFLTCAKQCVEAREYTKNISKLCHWCCYKKYCLDGVDYDIIEG